MNCSEAQELLSPYHDGELLTELRSSIEQHLEICPVCAGALGEFRSMSGLASQLPEPVPPDHLWTAVEQQLAAESPTTTDALSPPVVGLTERRAILAAAVLIAAGIGLTLYFTSNGGQDNHMAVNFDRYLKEFVQDPDRAQQVLLSSYNSQAVSLPEAAAQLCYRPIATEELPAGFSLDSVRVFDMPCCKCVQTMYRRQDGKVLALFEHDSDQPIWFGKRPVVTCRCNGKSTRIVAFNDHLAASWPSGKRHLTLIGAQDISEIMQVMDHLEGLAPQPIRSQ